jgi:AraC-like DNA-binding protein
MTIRLRKDDFFSPPDSPLAMARRIPQWPFEDHSHEFSELVFITGGHGLHVTEEESYPIGMGDVFLITAHHKHGYRELKDLNLINIYYDQNELNFPTQDLYTLPGYQAFFKLEPAYRKQHRFQSRLQLSATELEHVIGLIDRLDRELRAQQQGFRFMAVAVFMQVVGYISRCYEPASSTASQSLLKIGEALSYLENHYDQPVALVELARLAHMSERNFLRVFRKIMGDTPINYLLRLRLAKAAELLRQDQMNITQVAYRVGFQDSNYFTRKFSEVFRMSPRRYQAQKKMNLPAGARHAAPLQEVNNPPSPSRRSAPR